MGIQKDMVSKFMGDLIERENWRRAYELLWWQIYVAYMSGNVASRTPTRSKVFIPLIFQIIEIATPKLISFTSGNESLFDVVANDINEADVAKNIKRLLTDQFDKNEFDDKYETFVEMNKAGILCFLYDAPHNQRYDVGFKRIKNLSELKHL